MRGAEELEVFGRIETPLGNFPDVVEIQPTAFFATPPFGRAEVALVALSRDHVVLYRGGNRMATGRGRLGDNVSSAFLSPFWVFLFTGNLGRPGNDFLKRSGPTKLLRKQVAQDFEILFGLRVDRNFHLRKLTRDGANRFLPVRPRIHRRHFAFEFFPEERKWPFRSKQRGSPASPREQSAALAKASAPPKPPPDPVGEFPQPSPQRF